MYRKSLVPTIIIIIVFFLTNYPTKSKIQKSCDCRKRFRYSRGYSRKLHNKNVIYTEQKKKKIKSRISVKPICIVYGRNVKINEFATKSHPYMKNYNIAVLDINGMHAT